MAEEVRAEIIETVSDNGGHLGPSLGVVELTIALHAELDVPRDAIVWDVGHQCYAHKLLTGRLAEFRSIRKYGGLSGFPSRDESALDAYGTGHASTAVGAAVGLVEARRLGRRSEQNPVGEGATGQRAPSARMWAAL